MERCAVAVRAFQPLDGTKVEVISRLIQQEQIRLLQQDFAQAHPHLPPARVARHQSCSIKHVIMG